MSDIMFDCYKNSLKKRFYGILCEKEKNGQWEKFLDSTLRELYGFRANSINWWRLIGKLGELKYLNYEYFRSTIFECMGLVDHIEVPDELP